MSQKGFALEVYQVIKKANVIAIVMEIAQCTLKQFLKENQQKNDNQKIIYIMLNLLEGMKALESNKIIHFVIKPDNILLDQNLEAKFSDFNISTTLDIDKSYISQCKGGTFKYISPESLLSDKNVHKITNKTDIYSLGIVFLELLGIQISFDEASDYRRNRQQILDLSFFNNCQLRYELYDLVIKNMLNSNPDYRNINQVYKFIQQHRYLQKFMEDFNFPQRQLDILKKEKVPFNLVFIGPPMAGKTEFILRSYTISAERCRNILINYFAITDQIVLVFNNNYNDLYELQSFFKSIEQGLQNSRNKNKKIIFLCYGKNEKIKIQDEINFANEYQWILIRSNYEEENIIQALHVICKTSVFNIIEANKI